MHWLGSLSKTEAEILAADLKSIHLLEPAVKVSCFRNGQDIFLSYFSVNESNTFTYCNDTEGLMTEMNNKYNPEAWRIFRCSPKKILEAVLLYYDISKISILIVHGINMKETYDSIKLVLDAVKYEEYE